MGPLLRISDSSPQEGFRAQFSWTGIAILVCFGILLVQLWYIQIFNGRRWREFSEANRIEVKRIPAKRGRILDRNGVVLVDSRASFDLVLTPSRVRGSVLETSSQISQLLSWKNFDWKAFQEKLRVSNPHDSLVLQRDLSRDELALLMVRDYAFPGVEIFASPARSYPYGEHASHLFGYLGEISRHELRLLQKEENGSYQMGDVWGIAGVERTFEHILRGEFGADPIVEDAWGRQITWRFSDAILPSFQARDPVPGHDLILSLDADVQEAAEEALTYPAGGVVALDPNNGDVLALVSKPEYLLEGFVRGVSSDYWAELLQDPTKPLYDRALQGLYPPASTFKMITAIAALEEKVVTPEEKVFCPGFYKLGRETKKCWKQHGHGWVDLHTAIVQSCDVYFYEMGRRLGIDRLAKYASLLGLGRATGININQEAAGLVPTEAWKRRVYGQPWVGGESLSVAIGQGALQVTPIQMAVALAALVNGGRVVVPRIALRAQSSEGRIAEVFSENVHSKVFIAEETLMHVLRGLTGVVNEPGGTAYWSARSQDLVIGGKTGTAQVVSERSIKKIRDHAWFVAFAPVERPKIVVTVIVEHGGHGGATAAPIAKKVIEAYLRKAT